MDLTRHSIPSPVVHRLPKYLVQVQDLRREGEDWVSSRQLADSLGLTSSTVRQDLSHLDICGISKRGYDASMLESALQRELGAKKGWKAVIVGAGNLGRALATHDEFARQGFDIRGIFDANPKVVGKRVGKLVVRDVAEMPVAVKECAVDIGILAVPGAAAQEVADQLVAAGVTGLLNLSRAHPRVPENVAMVDARILESLQELSCLIHLKRRRRPRTKGCRQRKREQVKT